MQFARFIEFVRVIKAEALSKFKTYFTREGLVIPQLSENWTPSPRECLVQISQLFWFFLVPTYFFNY